MSYSEYVNACKEFAESNQDLIDIVNKSKETPQSVLWQKTVSNKLENETAKCLRKDGEFYFTEELVNKLMHFAFLKGQKGFDERSFNSGWANCRKEMLSALGVTEEE